MRGLEADRLDQRIDQRGMIVHCQIDLKAKEFTRTGNMIVVFDTRIHFQEPLLLYSPFNGCVVYFRFFGVCEFYFNK